MIKFFLLFLLFGTPAAAAEFRHFDSWTNKEKAEFITYGSLVYIDYKQSTWALKQRDANGNRLFREINPMFGKYPDDQELLVAQILSMGVYYYLVGNSYDPHTRGTILGLRLAAVIHNDGMGARIYKVF